MRTSVAADAFIVRDIRLEGLQRITAGTVFNYLPIKVGDALDDTRTAEIVRTLFRTGFSATYGSSATATPSSCR